MDYKQKYLKYKTKYLDLKQGIYVQGTNLKNKYLDLKGGVVGLEDLPDVLFCEFLMNLEWREIIDFLKANPRRLDVVRTCHFDFYDQAPMTFTTFRRYFPSAVGLNLSGDRTLVDANFAEFANGFTSPALADGMRSPAVKRTRGIKRLNMSHCDQVGITDAAFNNLRGIHTLKMNSCSQVGITDAAFVNLRGIHTLDMSVCNQVGITDAAFVNLRGIHTLNMRGCWQVGITDAAFVNLRGIHTLNVINCRPNIIAVARALGLNVIY